MTVEVKENVLGRTITARTADGQLIAIAVEEDDGWHITCGALPGMRVETFDDAHELVKYFEVADRREMNGDVVAIRGDEVRHLFSMFANYRPAVVRVWIDPIDRAVKFKFGTGTWSPPLGRIEEQA